MNIHWVTPTADTNYSTVTITPDSDFTDDGPTSISINANRTGQASFYNTTSRGTSDGPAYTITGAVVTENISLTTNAIKEFVPIDPPYAFTKDGIVDCDQGMGITQDITLDKTLSFRNVGRFFIGAVLKVSGYEQPADKSCQVVFEGGSLEVV